MDLLIQLTFKETVAYDLLIAILTGLLSAGAFFLVLRVFKPKIKICDKITRIPIKLEDGTDSFKYQFKFYNATYSNIENVSIDLFLMEDFFHGSGKDYNTKELKIAQPSFKFLVGKADKDKEIHNNCVKMTIKEDLESFWNGKREWLHLQIDSTHSKSGRRKVYVKTFKDPTVSIVNGCFDSGENFNII
tara:strand:- start:401 stop:967 length:567 start_codon:yes stop_codon:yes gene_type:complete